MLVVCLRIGAGDKNVLRQVVAQTMPLEDCRALGQRYASFLTDNMLCVWFAEGGENVYSMKPGSSLVCREGDSWRQRGFATWGIDGVVNATQPDVQSSIVKYLPWIEQNTRGRFRPVLLHICFSVFYTF